MSEQQFPYTEYFFRAYFIPDWDMIYDWKNKKPSFERVIEEFKVRESVERVVQTKLEIEILIKQNLSEDKLRHMVNRKLGARIYPPGIDMTYQEWLEKVLELLGNGDVEDFVEE